MILGFQDNIFAPDVLENPDRIGNITKPKSINCLPSCEVHELSAQTSHSAFPQKENFFYQKEFCITASHILQATCKPETYFSWADRIWKHRDEFLSIR